MDNTSKFDYLTLMGIQCWQLKIQNQANLMLIRETPGFYEDQKEEPFVDNTEQLLNAMLKAIGLDRNTVSITNISISQSTGFLTPKIAVVQPKLLLALGRIAGQHLLNSQVPLEEMRGTMHHYGISSIPVLVTYDPAYLLRNPQDKSKAFQDLQWVLKILSDHDSPNMVLQKTL